MSIKNIFIISLLFISCSKRMATYSSEPYYKLVESISENAEDLKKEVRKSKVQLEMDFETGDFKGRYKDTDFQGNYIIEHTSAGFAKGFYYRVSLGGLSKGLSHTSEEEEFFEQLIRCKKISVIPDKLANPSYIRLELSDNDRKIQLVKFLKPLE